MYDLIQESIGCGNNQKIDNLIQVRTHMEIRDLFKLMLCPSIIYNTTKLPEYCENNVYKLNTTDCVLVSALNNLLMDDLRGKELSKRLSSIIRISSIEMYEVLKWVIARKNPAEISKSTVNKVWPGLIRTQEYMGAVAGTDAALDRLFKDAKGQINAQIKIDGQCLLVDYVNGSAVSGHTRQGNEIGKYFPGFMKSLNTVHGFNGMVHFELNVGGIYRAKGNGLINSQVKTGIVGGDIDESLIATCLDLKDNDYPEMTQEERYLNLLEFENHFVGRVLQTGVDNEQEAREYANNVISAGGEGIVLKDSEQVFKNTKPWYCVKLKNEFTVELRCVSIKMHKTKKDLIGSLVMQSEDGLLEVNVNAKCDADREINAIDWIDNIFQVKAESTTPPKGKKKAKLYLPRFDGECYKEYIRIDKTKANTLEEILKEEEMSKCA